MNGGTKNTLKHVVCPLVAAFIWGSAFLVQGSVTDKLGAFSVNALRSLVAVICLFSLSLFIDIRKIKRNECVGKSDFKSFFRGGLACGVFLFLGANFQQLAIEGNVGGFITEGVVAFITAFYMVLVPVAETFLGRETGAFVWIAVAIAIAGLYLICVDGAFRFNKYILFAVLNAVFYTFHILAVDRFAPKIDPIKLSCGMFLFNFIFSSVCALAFEKIDFAAVKDCALPILYIGLFSSTIGFTLQIVAQSGGNPTLVSLLMCMESVFALLIQIVIGFLFPEKRAILSLPQYFGCGLMFAAVVISQIGAGKTDKNRVSERLDK